jgi:regulatory protein
MAFKRPAILDNENALYDYALGALGRRMRSVAELKRLMRARVTSDEHGELLMETVIARLKENKYLNDSSYAAAFSGFRRDNEKFGRRRVITDLKARGVHGDVIEKAVTAAFRDVSEAEQARAFLRRKRLRKPENDRETARIFRALMRAGFSTTTSIKLLKDWNVDDETLTALEEESSESQS